MENRIYNIFKSLVESGTKYIVKIYTNFNDTIIVYNINNVDIKFYADTYDLKRPVLYIKDKFYRIPEITSRSEKAHILDTIDNTIKEWEDKQLKSIESVFNNTEIIEDDF